MVRNEEEDIPQLMRARRLDKGLTLRELAAQVGISPSALARIEHGKSLPAPGVWERVLAALGVRNVASGTRQGIGEFVRARRSRNRMTQRELGELAGVGLRFVSELERGKASLRLDVVNKVLAVFGKTLGITDRPKKDEEP